jgi:prolyl-tRNA editing enzyme YbaK/EbsC (Cys-tRNA(Pro) deacylase)
VHRASATVRATALTVALPLLNGTDFPVLRAVNRLLIRPILAGEGKMPETAAEAAGLLRAAGFGGEVREMPADVPTAAAAAAALGVPVGAIANSLVFRAGEAPLLVLTSGAHRVDTGRVAALLGISRGRVRSAQPGYVLEVTGQVAGGVAPAGHPAPIRTLVDTWLERYPEVWAGGGLPHLMFRTSFAELVAVTGGEPADVGARPVSNADAGR